MSSTSGEGGGSRGYQRLKSHQTLGEVLETAMSFEQSAQECYTHLLERVSKPLRSLVQELADEEQEHYALFQQLKHNPDVPVKKSESVVIARDEHGTTFVPCPVRSDQSSLLQDLFDQVI